MSEFATSALDSVGTNERIETIDDRTIRALTEKMTVLSKGGNVYAVNTESGNEYYVDAHNDSRCTCPDSEYGEPEGGCKHYRRVQFATGDRTIPDCLDKERVDPQLGEHLDDEQSTDDFQFTRHVESEKQGGEEYVRCEECGRELLCRLGGRKNLPHKHGCPNGRDA